MHRISCLGAFLLINAMAIAQTGKEVPQKVDRSKIENRVRNSSEAEPLNAQTLWELGRVSGEGIWENGQQLIFGVSQYDVKTNKSDKDLFLIPLAGGDITPISGQDGSESLLKVEEDEAYYMLDGQIWKKNLRTEESRQFDEL